MNNKTQTSHVANFPPLQKRFSLTSPPLAFVLIIFDDFDYTNKKMFPLPTNYVKDKSFYSSIFHLQVVSMGFLKYIISRHFFLFLKFLAHKKHKNSIFSLSNMIYFSFIAPTFHDENSMLTTGVDIFVVVLGGHQR